MQKQKQYNRNTKGYRRNIAKGEMNKAGVKPPKEMNIKLLAKISIWLFAIWLIATILLARKWGLPIVTLMLTLALIYMVGMYTYINRYHRSIIRVYKKLGIPFEVFMEEASHYNINPKNQKKLYKQWRRTKIKEGNKNV